MPPERPGATGPERQKGQDLNTAGNTRRPGDPLPQHNLETATHKAIEALRDQPDEQLAYLGARPAGHIWWLSVLNEVFHVDITGGQVRTADGIDVGPMWRILALHYLDVRTRIEVASPEITFASLGSARAYADVYEARVTRRLCATVGRDAASLGAAAASIGARAVEGGDAAFEAAVFPRVSVRLVWYAGDDEFSPSAILLLPGNIESYFCVEDIVVMSERLVSRLSGKSF